MNKKFTLPAPDPFQRVKDWAFNAVWDVFGDYLPGMPSWIISPHEDGRITASDGHGTSIDLGTWKYDRAYDNIEIEISHDYPTSHD